MLVEPVLRGCYGLHMHSTQENIRGAVLMMATMAAYTLNDACMKALGGRLPLFESVFLRGVLTTAVLALIAWRTGAFRAAVPPGQWRLVLLRAFAETAAALFYFKALFNMELANVIAILQALPLTVTLAAFLFLGEPLGWRRMLAIVIGFGGVLMIVRPGLEGFNAFSVYALISVLFVTLRDLLVRRMAPEVPSVLIAVVTTAAVGLGGLAGAFFEEWHLPDTQGAGLLGLATLFIIAGSLLSVMMMRVGDIAFVTLFRYTSLIWALVIGWFFFGEWPDALTLAGSAIVAATGIFTLYRAARARRLHRKGS